MFINSAFLVYNHIMEFYTAFTKNEIDLYMLVKKDLQ